MAQTIALQRGTASITWDGTTLYTLFTQSGGTATRVCIGGIAAYASTTGGMAMGMFVKQSGVSAWTTVAIKAIGTTSTSYTMDFFGGSAINNPSGNVTSANVSANNQTVIAMTAQANKYPAEQNFNSMLIYGGTTNVYAGSNANGNFEVCPQQFWIGPGDAVVMKFFHNSSSSATGQVAYSFTTITES